MTTLYFEASDEDDFRIIGYSKDGKHQQPQIMIGLLVCNHGFPIGYQIFEGNTSETKTLTIYKELERLLRKNNIELSAEKAIEQIKEIRQLPYILPKSGQKFYNPLECRPGSSK